MSGAVQGPQSLDEAIAMVDTVSKALAGPDVVKCDSPKRCAEIRDALFRRQTIVVSGKKTAPDPSKHLCLGCEAHWRATQLAGVLHGIRRDRARFGEVAK